MLGAQEGAALTFLLVVLVIAAWASALLLPDERPLLRGLLALLFGILGLGLVLLGWLSYGWDKAMRPGQADATPLVCGLLMLAASLWNLLRAMAAGDLDD